MGVKFFLGGLTILLFQFSFAQQVVFSDNFEHQKIDSCWNVVYGKWVIADVEDLRIAPSPSEKGYRYVLCTSDSNSDGEAAIRLTVLLPHSNKSVRIKLHFAYYIPAGGSGARLEGEFYEKEIKDGLRGKPWTINFTSVKGKWAFFQKVVTIPARANTLYLSFFGRKSAAQKERFICFDSISVMAVK